MGAVFKQPESSEMHATTTTQTAPTQTHQAYCHPQVHMFQASAQHQGAQTVCDQLNLLDWLLPSLTAVPMPAG